MTIEIEGEQKICHGTSCHNYSIDSYDNGWISCRDCGESAWIGCDECDQPDCAVRCHYEIVGGGYLSDGPSHTLRCRHCGSIALID
jgi:hypothetical protein